MKEHKHILYETQTKSKIGGKWKVMWQCAINECNYYEWRNE